MITLKIYSNPVPWTPPRIFDSRHYDPKGEEKDRVRWQLRALYREDPLSCRVHVDFTFFFPIPKNTSAVRRREMLAHRLVPLGRPDTTNLQKFYEDCLKGIIITDDKNVSDLSSRKRYSTQPGVTINVLRLNYKDHLEASRELVLNMLDIER